jgi:hypothetical protein
MTKPVFFKPYHDEQADLEYNLLFCDNLQLYRQQSVRFVGEEWQSVLAFRPKRDNLHSIVLKGEAPARAKILSYNYLKAKGINFEKKELLGVILEAGVDTGLETLAAYTDAGAIYIDSSAKILRWQAGQTRIQNELASYFAASVKLAEQLKPSDHLRFPPPFAGMARITVLLSDGLYFGQGPSNNLTKDSLSGPLIRQANQWLSKLMTVS